MCAEQVDDGARFCEFCGSDLNEGAPAAAAQLAPSRAGLGYPPVAPPPAGWQHVGPTPPDAAPGQGYPPPGFGPPSGFGAQPGYGPPPAYCVAQRTNGMAIAALVCSLFWLWGLGSLLAVIFGYSAKSQIDRSHGQEGGRGLAVAGIVIGWIGLALTILATILIVVAAQHTSSSGY